MKIQNGISLTPPSPEAKAAQQDAALKDAASMYENYFLNEMVRAMRSTVHRDENSLLKQNFAEKIFSQQLDQQYVDGWSKKGGVGLADMIYSQISERMKSAGPGNGMMAPGARKGVLPIAPKSEAHGVPHADSVQMKTLPPEPQAKLNYRFEIPSPSGAPFEAQSPMSGKVVESKRLDQGWNLVKLDHGQGLTSELTFPGTAPETVAGTEVQAGEKLGILDSGRPVLAWKLDWS